MGVASSGSRPFNEEEKHEITQSLEKSITSSLHTDPSMVDYDYDANIDQAEVVYNLQGRSKKVHEEGDDEDGNIRVNDDGLSPFYPN